MATGFKHYKFREHVIFHDDKQCEIRGLVIQEDNYDDRVVLLIELDDKEGHYTATIMRRNK